jgi:hypothetical protein
MNEVSDPARGPISRDDIESSLRAIQTGVTTTVKSKQARIAQGAAVAAVIVVLIFFLLGKRSGRKKTTVVEIRRV